MQNLGVCYLYILCIVPQKAIGGELFISVFGAQKSHLKSQCFMPAVVYCTVCIERFEAVYLRSRWVIAQEGKMF